LFRSDGLEHDGAVRRALPTVDAANRGSRRPVELADDPHDRPERAPGPPPLRRHDRAMAADRVPSDALHTGGGRSGRSPAAGAATGGLTVPMAMRNRTAIFSPPAGSRSQPTISSC